MLDPKVQLNIALTEPVVFLRSSDPSGRHQSDPNDPLTLVRGILNLHVSKPISVSSIEAELTGGLTIMCIEGIGAGRMELPEKRKVFSSKVTVFRAAQVPRYGRRPVSVGPGLRVSTANGNNDGGHATGTFVSPPVSPEQHPAGQIATAFPDPDPTPPYTPMCQSPSSIQTRVCAHAENPAHTLEELRQALRDNLETHQGELALASAGAPSSRRHSMPFGLTSPTRHLNTSCASNDQNARTDDIAHPGSPFDDHSSRNSIGGDASFSPSRSSRAHSPEDTHGTQSCTGENSHDVTTGRSRFHISLGSILDAVMEVTSKGPSRSRSLARAEERERGRSPVRNVAERQGSPESASHPARDHAEHQEHHLLGLGRVLGLERDHEKEKRKSMEHGCWTEFKPGTYSYPISFLLPPNLPPTFSLPHGSLDYVIKGIVHRPGTFTSKISCQVPLFVVAAPTIGVGEGGDPGPLFIQKQWEGKLAYSLGLSSRLFLLGSRRHLGAETGEGSSANTESLLESEVETRSEPGYGTVTLDLTLLPLEKLKIWKLSIFVDQRIKYIDKEGKLYRDDDSTRVALLDLQDACSESEIDLLHEEHARKNKHKCNGLTQIPLLPTPLSPHRSPLLRLVPASTDPSVLAGLGPYTLSASVGLPSCNGAFGGLNFTMRQKNSVIKVEHHLRIVLRVESIGDLDTPSHEGDKKKFDIAVQTPITILSCRCAPEYQTLPQYSQITRSTLEDDDCAGCPCQPYDVVGPTAQGHFSPETYEHLEHHRVSSSSTSSFENEQGEFMSAAASHPHSHHARQGSSDMQYSGSSPRAAFGSARVSLASSPMTPEGPPGPGWSSSVHTQDRVSQMPSHPGQPHFPHPHPQPVHRHSDSRSSPSHSRSRTHTPISTPHPSRPPSPVLAERYERLVSGLESDAGEAPPSYYESVASNDL